MTTVKLIHLQAVIIGLLLFLCLKNIYVNNTDGHTPENYLKVFKNIKENQILYKKYFKLGFDLTYEIDYFNKDLEKQLKKEPEKILEILKSEYSKKTLNLEDPKFYFHTLHKVFLLTLTKIIRYAIDKRNPPSTSLV